MSQMTRSWAPPRTLPRRLPHLSSKGLLLLADSMKEAFRPEQRHRQQQSLNIAGKGRGPWEGTPPGVLALRGLLPGDYEEVFGGDTGEGHNKLGAAYDAVLSKKQMPRHSFYLVVTKYELQARYEEMSDGSISNSDDPSFTYH